MDENESVGAVDLEKAIRNNRVPHGVVLECSQPQQLQRYVTMLCCWAVCRADSKPCGSCPQCYKAENSIHPDIYMAQLSGKSEVVNVDEIRKICNDAYIKPNEADIKVYIIPNADKMQQQAQNAFLKVLEEPPQNILFILCCNSSQQLLGTIRSRVTIYDLNLTISSDDDILEARERATEIALALPHTKGYGLLCAVGVFKDRNFAKNVIDSLFDILNEAIKSKVTHTECSSECKMLCERIETINLLNIVDTLATAKLMLNSNVNMNLFSAWLCAELRRKK